ncbi:MAG: glycosyltransferase family 2 protein [Candidatus Saccharimonadales bacterium]
MKKRLKNGVRYGIRVTSKVANSNRYTKKLKEKAKANLNRLLSNSIQREVYNLDSFYPSIQEYYRQSNLPVKSEDPLISIILPTYNTPITYLKECLDSIIIQSYSKWELCISDDHSTNKEVIEIIKDYQSKDKRIKFIERESNGHISLASNSALELASGEFVGLMDHDDILWPNALFEVVKTIRNNKNIDFIYSDEDKIDASGKMHSYPFLKPDFSPEFLECCNYITHFTCIRRSLVSEIGGFRQGYEGAQDWDLFIRATELTENIKHIPKILYSWRIHEASTASDTDAKPYVYEAQLKLLKDHLVRLKRRGKIEKGNIKQHRIIKYEIEKKVTVAIVIIYSSIADSKALIKSLIDNESGYKFKLFILSDKELSEGQKNTLQLFAKSINTEYLVKDSNYFLNKVKNINADIAVCVDDSVRITSKDWLKVLIADVLIKKVCVVSPVLLSETKELIRSAGLGVNYGPTRLANMLEGTLFEDPHYARGLYARSRRNVSSVSDAMFAIKINDIVECQNLTELCLTYLSKGHRHIYTPYVQAIILRQKEFVYNGDKQFEDPYLNPNFNHTNGLMEVKS